MTEGRPSPIGRHDVIRQEGEPYQVVIVALDGTTDADRALPVAHSLAHRIGARLDAVVVTSPGVEPDDDEREVHAHARVADVAIDRVRLRYDEDVASGVLAEAASDDSLLCLTSSARGAVAEAVLGSVSGEIVRRSGGPLLLVGPSVVTNPPPSFDAVLVCVDGSPVSRAGWSRGRPVGGNPRRPAHVLQVEEDEVAISERRRRQSAASRIAASLEGQNVDTTWEVVIDERLAELILGSAAHLPGPTVVLGTHAASRRRRPALGTVSAAVVRHSPFPVLVVPA